MAKIYQLYYTRLGKQGSGAGWQVAAASQDTPQLVKDSFYKLASNLVAAGGKSHVPPMAFDLQIMENYAFLSHVNYHSVNEEGETDARGISFVHGFAIHDEEYRELLRKPEQLLGISGDEITLNYNGKKELPVLEEVAYGTFSKDELLKKYQLLDMEKFSRLMHWVYEAMGTPGGSLVIKSSDCSGENMRILFQEMIWLIMGYMPYVLRLKISAFSGMRQGAMLCFCDVQPEKGNWFDLDTGKSSREPKMDYEFIKYFSKPLFSDFMKDKQFGQLEEFVKVTYRGNYKALKLNHMELAYRSILNSEEAKIEKEKLDEYILEAVNLKAFKYDELDKYYGKLIKHYVDKGWKFPTKDVLKRLQHRYLDTNCQNLKDAFEDYYVKNVCQPGQQSAYEMLGYMESKRPKECQKLRTKLEDCRPDFLDAYYVDYYLESHIGDYQTLEAVCKSEWERLDGPIGEKLLDIMGKVFEKEISGNHTNAERYEICRRYMELCRLFPESFRGRKNSPMEAFRNGYWEKFEEKEFSYHAKSEYVEMGAGEEELITAVPEKVIRLLEAWKKFLSGPDLENFRTVFFKEQIIEDESDRRRLKEEFFEEARKEKDLPLDAYLLLNSRAGGRFNIPQLLKDMKGNQGLKAGGIELNRALRSSQVLGEGEKARAIFMKQIEDALNGGNRNSLIEEFYWFFFPPRVEEKGRCMADLIQKCQLFLAIAMADAVWARYFVDKELAFGIAALITVAVAAVPGLVMWLTYGDTNSMDFLMEGDKEAVGWVVVFTAISLVILVAAAMVDGSLMACFLTAAATILLIGRIILKRYYKIM